MDKTVYYSMKRSMDEIALTEGRKRMYETIFRSKYCHAYLPSGLDMVGFVRETVDFKKMPDEASVQFLMAYFTDQLTEDYGHYRELMGGASDEADEQA